MKSSLLSLVRSAAAMLVVSLVALASCAEGGESACERNSDCDRGYCQEGKCRRDCVDSTLDCPKGYACSVIGRCEFAGNPAGAGGDGGAAGESGAAGTTAEAGMSGIAGTAGTASTAGTAGQSGQAGTGPTAGGGQAGSEQGGAGQGGGTAGTEQGGAGQSGGGTAGSGTAGTGSGGEPFGGGGTSGTGLELDACFSDSDCTAGLLCRAEFKGGPQRCTKACSSQSQCYGGRRCEMIDGAQVCVMGDVGRDCKVANDCNFACLLGQNYCTSTCKTGGDCPNGYACQPVGTPAQYICAKVAAPCDANSNACIAPAACDKTSQNLIVASCTAACNSAADCPQRAPGLPPWTCDGLCRRPSDVFGPLEGGSTPTQYACGPSGTPVNLCNDGQHIDFFAFNIPDPPSVNCNDPFTTSGINTDSCVDSCRYEGGCPWGFTCTAVGNVNNSRIGLCLVNGGAPVGTPCTDGTECSFGYCTLAGKCSRDCTADGLCPSGSTCTAAGGPPAQGLPFKRCE